MRSRLVFPREVLLVEVERWHRDASCGARTRLPLTKQDARSYTGFECARCELWQADSLSERDIPEWWEELKLTSLDGVRAQESKSASEKAEPCSVVTRLSDAWNSLDACGEAETSGKEDGAGDSF